MKLTIRETVDRAPMSAYQLMIVGICLLVILAEGYDLLIMAFAMTGVATEWSLDGTQSGILLSSALFGMAIGSAFIAPIADVVGRRRHSIVSLFVVAATMGLAALSTNEIQLGICRFFTGVAIGGLVASLPVVVAEFAPKRRRGTMIALYTTGLPLGGVIGAIVASALLASYGWRASFAVGACVTFLLFLVALFAMPESIDFLATRRPKRALESINRTLSRMRIGAIDELPAVEQRKRTSAAREVFAGRSGVRTMLLGLAFFLMMAAFYFATSWTPRLLEQSGLSAEQGINGGMLLNLGGAVTVLIFSLLAAYINSRMLTIVAFFGAAIALVAMSFSMGSMTFAMVAAVAVGAMINANATGLFAISPDNYPARARATGVGFVAAIGRIGAIVSPLLAGVLVDAGWSPSSLFVLFAVPLVLGALAIIALRFVGPPSDPDVRDPAAPSPAAVSS